MAQINETFEDIKARLLSSKEGEKLIRHLSAIIDSSSLLMGEDPVDKFEETSIILKKTAPKDGNEHPINKNLLDFIQGSLNLLQVSHLFRSLVL